MKRVFQILQFAGFFSLMAFACKSTDKSISASSNSMMEIQVSFTSNYWGGASPSEEIIKSLKAPKVLQNQELFVVGNDSEDQGQTVKTDKNGRLSLSLTSGRYSFYFPEKKVNYVSKFASQKTCEEWKSTPNGTLEVSGDQNTYELVLHRTCSPCTEPPR